MTFNAWSVFFDFAVISVLLVLGQVLRAKLGILQKFMIPASLIAGSLGLALGSQGLGYIKFSNQLETYAGILIVVVFAALPLGLKLAGVRGMGREVGELWNCVTVSLFSQYGFGMLFGLFVLGIFWDLYPGFGYMLGVAFFGGHGTAAAIAESFKTYGWGDEAFALGMTGSTLGIVFAIIPGVILNNIAARKGWCVEVSSPEEVKDKELLTGLVPHKDRKPIGMETVSGSSMESLTFHLALILVAALGGWYINKGLKVIWPSVDIPTFALGLFVAYLLQLIMELTKSDIHVDRKTLSSISGMCADYLVVAGISSIKVAVIIKYAVPFALLMLFGFILCVFIALVLGPKMFKEYWFERSMFVYGFATGSVINSILLLRMIDPHMKSKALDIYAVVGLLDRPLVIALFVFGPLMIGTGYAVQFAALVSILTFVPIVVAKMAGWWYPKKGWEPVQKTQSNEDA